MAVGPGLRTESGTQITPAVAEGDRVLLPEFGGTKIELDDQEYLLFRDSDLLGTFQ